MVPVAERAAPVAEPMLPARARIERRRRETQDTFSFDLAGIDDQLPAFQPGQFSMLYVFGVAELPISISGDPATQARMTYTVRSVGLATNALVGKTENDCVGVRGPYGRGWPIRQSRERDLLLVAGGIGLAPLRPVVLHALHHRKHYGRVVLLYGARSPGDVLYRGQLAQWGRQPDTQVMTTVDYGGLDWRGNVGVVTTLFRHIRMDPRRTTAMICGPEVMIRQVGMNLEQRGIAPADIWVSMERNMKCGVGLCGHCQFGPSFVCKEGPVYPLERVKAWMNRYEV